MSNLKLYTPCITDDAAYYSYVLNIDSNGTFNITVDQAYKDLSADQLIFSCKSAGNSKGIEVNLLQDKTGIEIVTSDGVSSYTDTLSISFTDNKLYSNVFVWSGIVGDDAFFSNGGTLQIIDTTNWLTWTGDSSTNLYIGCDSGTNLVKSSFATENQTATNHFNHNEGATVYDEGGVYNITLGTGNWQSILEHQAANTLRSYDVWQNDSTNEYILFYFKDNGTAFKTDGDTLTGYTWLTQIQDYAYISKYNGFKIVDPRDDITLLGYDEITDIAEDGYIFYNEVDGVIKGLIIYEEKQAGECYNKAVDNMDSMLLNALQDNTGEYIFDSNNEYIITRE